MVDYGGGTCDVAVVKIGDVTSAPGSIDLIAHDGSNGLGGKNLDAMIRRWVDKQLTSRAPDLLEYLRTEANLSTKRAVDDNIRRAKELLSESPRAVINISGGGHEAILELTRGEFEQLIATNVDSVVDLTRRTLARAGAGGDVQIYLTGGSSRVPLVQQRLGELGTVATLDNPKTVVALGALEALVAESDPAGSAPAPLPIPPVVGVPLSKPVPPEVTAGPPMPPVGPPPPTAPGWGTPGWDSPEAPDRRVRGHVPTAQYGTHPAVWIDTRSTARSPPTASDGRRVPPPVTACLPGNPARTRTASAISRSVRSPRSWWCWSPPFSGWPSPVPAVTTAPRPNRFDHLVHIHLDLDLHQVVDHQAPRAHDEDVDGRRWAGRRRPGPGRRQS